MVYVVSTVGNAQAGMVESDLLLGNSRGLLIQLVTIGLKMQLNRSVSGSLEKG